jgi:hypothetical protein
MQCGIGRRGTAHISYSFFRNISGGRFGEYELVLSGFRRQGSLNQDEN